MTARYGGGSLREPVATRQVQSPLERRLAREVSAALRIVLVGFAFLWAFLAPDRRRRWRR